MLNLSLPDMDGKQVIAAIREWSQIPILALSVRDAGTEKIVALDAGADEYATNDFATGKLLAGSAHCFATARRPTRKRPISSSAI